MSYAGTQARHAEEAALLRSRALLPGGKGLTFWVQWFVAMSLLMVLLAVLAFLKTGDVAMPYRILGTFTVLGSMPAYSGMRVYYKQQGYFGGLARLLGAWLILLAGLTVIAFVTKTSELFSREVTLVWAVLGFALQAAAYLPLHCLSRHYHLGLKAERTALIVGTGEIAVTLADKLVRVMGEPLVGFVATDDTGLSARSMRPVLGKLDALRHIITDQDIRRLYIALPLSDAQQIETLYIDLLDANVDVVWVPDLDSLMLLNHSVGHIDGMPAIHLNESPLTAYPTAALTKAAMDRCLALIAIILLGPLLLATALAVKLSSPGPVLFVQKRHGRNGKIIKIWKFRSMRLHDDGAVHQATRGDPRVTAVGRFIRRTSIDELPQLFNVLQGHMSLVGPRPHAVAHNDYYTGKIDAYMARHRIKPGITGLAQVSGCRGETETLEKMQKRVELDLAYINNWSLWLDVKILIKTPFTLFAKDIY